MLLSPTIVAAPQLRHMRRILLRISRHLPTLSHKYMAVDVSQKFADNFICQFVAWTGQNYFAVNGDERWAGG